MTDKQESIAQNFNLMESSMEKMWDMWLVSLGSLSSTQEQIENMTRKQVDQSRAAREVLIKLEEDRGKQVRKNQEQFQNMVEEAVKETYEYANKSNQQLTSNLSKQVEDLAKQISDLSKQFQDLSKKVDKK